MPSNTRGAARLAVLIDAENVSPSYVAPLLAGVAGLGTATARRIYGDWTDPQHLRWRNVLHSHALIPVQQFRLSSGRNCTDCALIIDAMDLLHSGRFDGFCLASSDGDFTRLACRIRESGLVVYGFGERKAPAAFVHACDRFTVLGPPGIPAEDREATEPGGKNGASHTMLGAAPACGPMDAAPPANGPAARGAAKSDPGLASLILSAYASVAGEDGWAHLAPVGSQLLKLSPSFDPRSAGHSKLGDLVVATGLFEVRKVASPGNPESQTWYIRAK